MAETLFTSRIGGVSAPPYDQFNLAQHVGDSSISVLKNRERLGELMGLASKDLFFMDQVHGNQIAIISESSDSSRLPVADGLFTQRSDIGLVVLTADCIPLLLASERAVAAVHVGRKGLVAGVIEATIAIFESYGIPSASITAEIGPSICGECYEVDLEMYREVVAQIPATATDESRHCLDLVAGACSILHSFEIEVTVSPECTSHSPGYFSYRRDRQTGRQSGMIRL